MPGGRSLGCKTCKDRKIKCDERRPTCCQCEKSGRYCPGTLTPFVYQAEMVKAEAIEAIPQNFRPSHRGIRWRPVIDGKSRSRTPSACKHLHRPHRPPSEVSNTITPSVPLSDSAKLVERLVNTLESTKGTGHDILVCGEWLPELASRIGRNDALDAAIDTLLLAHRDLNAEIKDHRQQIHAYGQALTRLNVQLTKNRNKTDVETLCAVLALCTVEVISGSEIEHPAWLSHAGGSAAMFQACGPGWLGSRFEKSLLYYHAGQFIASSLVTRTRCFLDSPEWLSVLEGDCEYLGTWDELQAKMVPVYAALPTLMRDINIPRCSINTTKRLLDRACFLRDRLLRLEGIAHAVLHDPDHVQEVPSQHPDSPFRLCYRFSTILSAQPLLLYWRLTIMLNNVIQKLFVESNSESSLPEELRESSLHAADQIAKSAEDGRRSMPVVSILHTFAIPPAIWAYARSPSGVWTWTAKTHWLATLLYEYLEPTKKLVRGMLVKYLDAVEMSYPGEVLFAGLTPEDWAKCRTEWTIPQHQIFSPSQRLGA